MSASAVNIPITADDQQMSARLLEVISAEVLKTSLFQEGDKLLECCLKQGRGATFLVQRQLKPVTPSQWLGEEVGGSSSSGSTFVWKLEVADFVPAAAWLAPPIYSNANVITESLSSYQTVLAQRLTTWVDQNAPVSRMPDKRTRRLAKELMVWTKIPNAQSEIELPTDLFSEMLDNAVSLALHERCRNQLAGVSFGSLAMQKVLVISSPMRKLQVIQHLRPSATIILHHRSGCFVASQILQEGLVCSANIDTDDNEHLGVAMAAVEFMGIAIESSIPELFETHLVKSIKSRDANHSVKLFIALLASLESAHNHALSTTYLEIIMAAVLPNALDLVRDCTGVRIINALLEEFGGSQRVTHLLDTLLDNPIQLTILIADEFANFAISAAVDVEHERICKVVCNHFVEYAMHIYASHVVRKCIEVAADVWVVCFSELFIANCDELASQQKISSCVRRTLENSLSTRNMLPQLRKLHTVRRKFMNISFF